MKNMPNNMNQNPEWLQTIQGHRHVGNHARIPNLAFIHFDYQRINMILSK